MIDDLLDILRFMPWGVYVLILIILMLLMYYRKDIINSIVDTKLGKIVGIKKSTKPPTKKR